MSTLIFVDTNIYLDFYRVTGGDKDLSILTKLESHLNVLVTTHQVEMEFKKNRQKVILEAHRSLKTNIQNQQFPAFLSSSKQAAALHKNEQGIQRLARVLQKKVGKVLTTPIQSDPVYKCTQRIFRSNSNCNLSRENKIRFTIRRLARKRFLLGYPPRKDSDLSIGDAVNWEWIICCAKKFGSDVVIVTRDKDFGETFDGSPIINDWLRQEFKERVSKKRNVEVTNRLSEALQRANITVTVAEQTQEEKLIRERPKPASLLAPEQFENSSNITSIAELKRLFNALNQTIPSGRSEGSDSSYHDLETLSNEEEIVLGHLYYEPKQSMDDLVKNTGLPDKVVSDVVNGLSHIIKKEKNGLLTARVINRSKARDLALPASKKRNK